MIPVSIYADKFVNRTIRPSPAEVALERRNIEARIGQELSQSLSQPGDSRCFRNRNVNRQHSDGYNKVHLWQVRHQHHEALANIQGARRPFEFLHIRSVHQDKSFITALARPRHLYQFKPKVSQRHHSYIEVFISPCRPARRKTNARRGRSASHFMKTSQRSKLTWKRYIGVELAYWKSLDRMC